MTCRHGIRSHGVSVDELRTYLAIAAVVIAVAFLIVVGGRIWLQFRDYWKWLS